VEDAHKFKEGDQVQFINNTNPNLILTVNSVSNNICDVWNEYVGNIRTSADKLESVPKPVLDALKEQQKLNEELLQQQRAHRAAVEKARQKYLDALDITG
jgi:hypothetical protein